jgi:hypothetical protein
MDYVELVNFVLENMVFTNLDYAMGGMLVLCKGTLSLFDAVTDGVFAQP